MLPTIQLLCLIEGEAIVFSVTAVPGDMVINLKRSIQSERAMDTLKNTGPHKLELWILKDPKSIAAEPEDTIVERMRLLGHDLSNFAVKLSSSRNVFSIFPTQPPYDYIHIIVKVPPTPISVPSQLPSARTVDIEGLNRLHKYLWGNDRIVRRDGTESISELILFNPLYLNTRPATILLVRNEYRLAYEHILTNTLEHPTTQQERSATLVTGQPGIGKTVFLFYVLARRLQERQSVAFQINRDIFVLFGQTGVTPHSTGPTPIPRGTWTLSDSDSSDGLCTAFQHPGVHVIHTSSPSSPRWKNWVKRLSASTYIMDVWTLKEIQTLFALNNLDFQKGEALVKKYGPSPRTIIDILTETTTEGEYERRVKGAAAQLGCNFLAVLSRLEALDFGANTSKIFTVKPESSQERHAFTLEISTPFLFRIFALAMSRQVVAQQRTLFRMFSYSPSFRNAGACLFDIYAHTHLSASNHEPLEAYSLEGAVHHIPIPAKIISGSTALKHIHPPHNFYWRPVTPNFASVNAIIRSDNDVWALQYTICRDHKAATDGLIMIRDGMNHTTGVKWHLVVVGSDLADAKAARNSQKLGDNWKWPINVYASELPLGRFDEQHAQRLDAIVNDANDADLVPD